MATDAVAVLDAAGWERAVIFGQCRSTGWATIYPGLWDRLVTEVTGLASA